MVRRIRGDTDRIPPPFNDSQSPDVHNALRSRCKGFTLIELLVVTVIIGILAAIVIPNFMSLRDRAKEASVKANMHSVQMAVENFATITGGYYPGDVDTRIGQVNPLLVGPVVLKSLCDGARVPPFPPDALLKAHQNFSNPFSASLNVIDNNLVAGPPPPVPPAGVNGCAYYSSYDLDGVTAGTAGQAAYYYCITGYGKGQPLSLSLP